MINDIRLTSEDSIEAVMVLEKLDLKLDNVVITMDRNIAKMVHKALEEALFDADTWNVNLQKEVEVLEAKIHFLEEV